MRLGKKDAVKIIKNKICKKKKNSRMAKRKIAGWQDEQDRRIGSRKGKVGRNRIEDLENFIYWELRTK
ncbi:MAG TPA: hypothetical protein VLG76_08395 [Rhabdochlamydiaceae bacterium]|nr:hypothetical protein [Rhabdochlamydiaceae bacterium]